MRFNEKDVKDGRKLAVKLWNAARFVLMQIEGFDPDAPRPDFAERMPEDRWLLTELNKILPGVAEGFETYNYAVARESIDRFFWATFCDDYLEMVKHRFWKPELYSEEARVSARATLWEALRTILALFAPFVPFTTEDLYQRIYRPVEGTVSLHVTRWPAFDPARTADVPEMQVVGGILRAVRQLRTEARLSQTRALAAVVIDLNAAVPRMAALVRAMEPSLQAVARAAEVRWGEASYSCEVEGVAVAIVPDAPLAEVPPL
jgi:valyl-tRNA synthetase